MPISHKSYEHRGIRFTVGPATPCPGIVWRIERLDHLGRSLGHRPSQGAFYDDCEDHPEGAYAWAEASCRKFIDCMLDDAHGGLV